MPKKQKENKFLLLLLSPFLALAVIIGFLLIAIEPHKPKKKKDLKKK